MSPNVAQMPNLVIIYFNMMVQSLIIIKSKFSFLRTSISKTFEFFDPMVDIFGSYLIHFHI
jgi:hypothetical protein